MITKTFEYKGQMINYFNKVSNNPKIASCWSAYVVGQGYTVSYTYKNN